MSHTTTIKSVAIRDVAAIKSAIDRLQKNGVNCSLLENSKPRMYYANQGEKCDYVLSLPNCKFDLGLKKQSDGTFAPMYDEHMNYVGSQIGAHCNLPKNRDDQSLHQIGQFLQAYTEFATINSASAAGYMVSSASTDKEGNVVLELESY